VFEGWAGREGRIELVAADLQDGVDVAAASMDDYAGNLRRLCAALPRPLALCGWSMGGLVAMMVAADVAPASLVLIEPSAPAEVQGTHAVPDAAGTFDPEEVYGAFPAGIRPRPESQRARADRKRGIAVPSLPPRTLVVYGDEFGDERGRALVERYGIDEAYFGGLDHWGLVLDASVRERVFDYVAGP
jgi:pimeloyl-ACP methyl ester carboxylesterase